MKVKTNTIKNLLINLQELNINLSNNNFPFNILAIIFILPFFQRNSLNAINFFFKFFSLIVGIRTISSTITEIPSSNPKCDTIKENLSLKNYILGHCFDKLFSGHTAFTLSLIFTAKKYNLISFKVYYFLVMLQILYTYFFLICTREHYSVDVFLSYIITVSIFSWLEDKI